ncbi:MAG: MarR family EPS-associated transcriptional regulator [Pseudomonadota bacterium]
MNNAYEHEIRYHLLKILSENSNLTQREMAKELGISLGKVNYCISELGKRGLVKIRRFKAAENKLQYIYILTPQGLEEKARLTLRFLRAKMQEYEEITRQIKELTLEIEEGGLEGIHPDEAFEWSQLKEF